VLKRFYDVAQDQGLRPGDVVVRLTGDCQLHDPAIIQDCVELFMSSEKCDLAGNQCPVDSFPDGQQVEIFTMRALTAAHEEATLTMELEHVTPFINRQPGIFAVEAFLCDPPKNHLRWTLDREEDFGFIKAVYDELYPGNPCFDTQDVDRLLGERPDIAATVAHLVTDAGANEGLRSSAKADGLQMVVTNGGGAVGGVASAAFRFVPPAPP